MSADHLNWVPADVDLTKPNAARVYDYILGGANNFEVDREFARKVLTTLPDAQAVAQENRAFLRRVVTFLAEQGIRQFIDLGSGIPTVGNTHEVAQAVAPDARVLYVDNEAVAVAHSELILQDNANAEVVRADIRDVRTVVHHPITRRLFDLDEPVAILAFLVLHFMSEAENPYLLVGRYRDETVPGSYLAVSHITKDGRPEVQQLLDDYEESVIEMTDRNRAQMHRFFAGYDLVDPGVVVTRDWRPEIELAYEHTSILYGGVGLRI